MDLDKWLEQNAITKTDFARKLGLSLASVSRLAAGLQTPSLATALKIEKITGGAVTGADLSRKAA